MLCNNQKIQAKAQTAMEQQLHDLENIHSPTVQLELINDLQNLGTGEKGIHLQFQEGQNPFSYYKESHEGDAHLSEDEERQNYNKLHSNLQTQQQNHLDFPVAVDPLETQFVEKDVDFVLPSHNPIISSTSNGIYQEKQKIEIVNQDPIADATQEQKFTVDVKQVVEVEANPNHQLSSIENNNKNSLNSEKTQLNNAKPRNKNIRIFDVKQEKTVQKVLFNKNYLSSPKTNSAKQIQIDQIRMLIKMAFQKKKANYAMLKEWDRKRAENLALHGRIIQLLQNEVDLRIKASLQNFQYYQTFFRQKAKQQQKYVTSPVINTRYALQNNSLSKNVYINCSVILNSLCDENTNRCKKINNFILLIRTNILKDLTESHLNSSQRQLLTIRQKISCLKSSLKKYNTETEEKANELANLFGEQSAITTDKLEKDFYRTQLSFLRKASQQIQVQTRLGQSCLQYYHTAIQQQLKRSQVIRESMVIYAEGLKQAYNLELQCDELDQTSKHQQIQQIESFYSLDEMLDARTIEIFKFKNNIKTNGGISLDMFTNYINKFHYEYFDSRVILLKQFYVKSSTTGKSKETVEENCYLAITVDNFLHMFFNWSKTGYHKPDITIKISQKCLQVKVMKDEFVDIIKKEERRNSMMSYFWDSKIQKIYRIKFSKKDNKEEFMDYINKLMADNY